MACSRRRFLECSSAVAVAAASARWVAADEVAEGATPLLRFAVASDLHYGQPKTPFEQMTKQMVAWINDEHQNKRLDALFLNGDLSNDSSDALLELRDGALAELAVPYYAIKGNHDFVDGQAGSPAESWEKIWGYPANHTVTIGDVVFIMADTSAPATSNVYRAADIEWLRRQLEAHRDAPAIFAMIHIPQRAHGVDGWPKHGVHDKTERLKGEAVMALLESTPNVRAVFHGHNHLETGVYVSGERRYFFDSHVGGSWGAKRGYRIVEAYADHKLVTYQMDAEAAQVTNRNAISFG
jgi:3',5'-cyclic AMP phosphodiesterase CpdA